MTTIDIELQNDVCVIRCKGRFIAGPDWEYIQEKTDEIRKLKCRRMLVDFSEVSMIGSMGITFIVSLYTSVVKESRGRFVLISLVPLVRQILDLTRLSTVIPIATDLASGFAELSVPTAKPIELCSSA
jgi:anti-anti-sigma factor